MSSISHPAIVVATAFGLTFNAYFSAGGLALTYFAIPAFLLPEDAPLMPPLDFVHKQRSSHFRPEKAPTQPADSGVGDEKERLIDSGATTATKTMEKLVGPSPSSTNYLLRQWFHVFAKGMHTYPPFAVGAAVIYLGCVVMYPGPLLDMQQQPLLMAKRACYLLAMLLSMGVPAFTLTAMKPVNTKLNEKVTGLCESEKENGKGELKARGKDGKREKDETVALIREWGRMNAIRCILPVAAGVCATVALAISV